MNVPNRYLTEATIAAVLILGPAITIGIAFDTKSGTIAAWVAAIATGGALIAAIYAGQQAAQIVDVERRRDDRLEANQRRAQAEQIAAWALGNKVWVLNASNLPVYQLQIIAQVGVHPAAVKLAVIPPTTREPKAQIYSEIHDAYAQAHADAQADRRKPSRTRISIAFTDAAGTRWERDFEGVLRELPDRDTTTERSENPPEAGGRLLV